VLNVRMLNEDNLLKSFYPTLRITLRWEETKLYSAHLVLCRANNFTI